MNCGNLGLILLSPLLDMINNTDEDPPSKTDGNQTL